MATVLVVDDDHDLCDALRELCEDEGFRAFGAYDPLEALSISERESIDVVLSDLNMPVMSGLQLCERLAALGGATLFVLTSTSRPREWPSERPFLTKPIDFDRLVRLVRHGATGPLAWPRSDLSGP